MRAHISTGDEQLDAELNSPTPNTADIARLQRIMAHREIQAMNGLHNGLTGVMETIQRAAQLASLKADEVMRNAESAGKAQRRMGIAMLFVTAVLAVTTVGYTWITYEAARETHISNEIQSEMLKIARNTSSRDARKASDGAQAIAPAANLVEKIPDAPATHTRDHSK